MLKIREGEGRVPVGVDKADPSFSNVEKIGGAKTHKLTFDRIANASIAEQFTSAGSSKQDFWDFTIEDATSHNNMQPYITCYMWKRAS
jgi:hypothetical protein